MSGTALAVDQAGDENDMTYQVEKAMDEANRRMNSALIFGPKRRGLGRVDTLKIPLTEAF